MRRLLPFIACLLATSALARDDTAQIQAQQYPVACVAKVTEVKKKVWNLETHERGTIAQGSHIITLQFKEPASLAGKVRRMCVYEEKDLKIEGRMLSPGDIISFAAFQSVLNQAVEPDVFTNLLQVKLKTMGESKLPPAKAAKEAPASSKPTAGSN